MTEKKEVYVCVCVCKCVHEEGSAVEPRNVCKLEAEKAAKYKFASERSEEIGFSVKRTQK